MIHTSKIVLEIINQFIYDLGVIEPRGTVSKWNDLEQHCEVMADAPPEHEQMPDGVVERNPLRQVEHDSDRVERAP